MGEESMKKLACGAWLAAVVLVQCFGRTGATRAKRGGFLAQLDLDFGGDDLATVSSTDGDSQDVKAGQGVAFGVGGWFRPGANPCRSRSQALLGYKYATTAADNADINVSRVVFELNGIYRFTNDWYRRRAGSRTT